MPKFNAKKVAKVKSVDPDDSYSIKGIGGGSFAIASSKKELKQLMKSDADVVYFESKGQLFLNENGSKKGWGKKKVGGLLAKFKGKPELSADQFAGLSAHTGDAITGGGGKKGGGKKGGPPPRPPPAWSPTQPWGGWTQGCGGGWGKGGPVYWQS